MIDQSCKLARIRKSQGYALLFGTQVVSDDDGKPK